MKKFLGVTVSLSLAAWAGASAAAGAEPLTLGSRLAASCAACHGIEGRSVQGTPVLAGVDRTSFIDAIKGFRDGSRKATVMHRHAKGYSEAEIVALADYYAAQPRQVAALQGK